MLTYRFLQFAKNFAPNPPRYSMTDLVKYFNESPTRLQIAIEFLEDEGWVNVSEDRYYITIEGENELVRANDRFEYHNSKAFKDQVLSGMKTKMKNGRVITVQSEISNAVLPKDLQPQFEECITEEEIDFIIHVQRIAKKQNKDPKDVLAEILDKN